MLADSPGYPASLRVIADIGGFAQAQGFARQPARSGPPVDPVTRESLPTAPERFLRDSIGLDIYYQPTTHRVSAYLHSAESTRDIKVIQRFYRDFHRDYAPKPRFPMIPAARTTPKGRITGRASATRGRPVCRTDRRTRTRLARRGFDPIYWRVGQAIPSCAPWMTKAQCFSRKLSF